MKSRSTLLAFASVLLIGSLTNVAMAGEINGLAIAAEIAPI
jgi:hypothetical protein